ncbi:hypothetical protein Tcan_16491 [Toxocara canis]|uniref:Chromatin target of PRMT1 protein C-terminal domain-containing protein n=2 Tax=Toxocara canis TaxID=6265 RepID=A0A0B2W4M3_TOXCA|nr:hypothetical protein Tcan_16491 [Toxocara canis]VDM43664.1 unnamed protein product [Toxocara canis]
MDVPIPARIILMGTSKISLNERFSKLPVGARRRPPAGTVTGYRSADHDYREPGVERSPTVDFKNGTAVDEDELLGVRFLPRFGGSTTVARAPRSYLQSFVPLKLRDRVKFPVKRNYLTFAPTRGYIRRGSYNGSRPFGLSRSMKNMRFKQNGFNSAFKSERYSNRGISRGTSGARGRGRAGFAFPRRQPITREQLDRELDAYMKRSKHPKIDVSDLMQA